MSAAERRMGSGTDRTARYRTIVADPPWDYGVDHERLPVSVHRWSDEARQMKRPPIPFKAMTVAAICELPVADLADDVGGTRLFLWTTNRFMPAAFSVLAAWGFTYRQTLVWHKTDAPPFGGSVAPNCAEFLLVAVCGEPPVLRRWPRSVVTTAKLAHSQKPETFLDLVEAVSPGPYLELFARRQRLGWDTWGDEALQHIADRLDGGAGAAGAISQLPLGSVLDIADRPRIERAVAGALASTIDAHGPITRVNHASAAKRVIGALKAHARASRSASESALPSLSAGTDETEKT